MKRTPFFVFVLLYAAPRARLAREGSADHVSGLPVWLWKTANLLVFFGLLVYLLAKPLSSFFHARREEIARQLADAARAREDAVKMKAEMESRVASLQGEIASLRDRLRADGERERAELGRQGEAEAARLLAQLDQEAQRRVAEARTQLAGEAASIAADLALELLEREITPADRERIFKRTLDRLTAPPAGVCGEPADRQAVRDGAVQGAREAGACPCCARSRASSPGSPRCCTRCRSSRARSRCPR